MGKQWKQCQTLFFWAPKSLEMVTAATYCDDERNTWFFSRCGGILELRRGIQASSCVGPASPIFHSTCQRELWVALACAASKTRPRAHGVCHHAHPLATVRFSKAQQYQAVPCSSSAVPVWPTTFFPVHCLHSYIQMQ